MERINYNDWTDAVRLTNGTAELIVVPSIGGRIMRYGRVGGENLLWEDDRLAGAAPGGERYKNFGGDKAWPWPQDDWKRRIGRVWPPPPAYGQMPCELERLDPLAVRVTTPVAPEFGFRIVREIRMSPRGTQVTIESRLVPAPGAATIAPAVPWHVTQMPPADLVMARVARDAGDPPFGPLPPHTPALVERVGRDILLLKSSDDNASKIGLDADLLAWVNGSTFLVQRLQPVQGQPPPRPHERAQVFFQSTSGPDAERYLELEFTAPRAAAAPDAVALKSLRVTWELHDLPRDLNTPDALAGYLRALW